MNTLKQAFVVSALTASIVTPTFAQSDLMMTGVMDGPLSGGKPKVIELYARADIPDLSRYAVSIASNGGATFNAITADFILPAISLSAGEYYYAVGNGFAGGDGTNEFDMIWPAYSGIRSLNFGVNSNGDDVEGLFYDPTGAFTGSQVLVDVIGELGVDGTGEPWEYLDGWAYSKNGRLPSATFNVGQWDFSGINALDPYGSDTAGIDAAFPDQTYVAVVPMSPPTITPIADQSIPANSSTGPLDFTVDDLQTAVADLVVVASSDNVTLVPNNSANLVFGGGGAARTLEVIPAAGQEGVANIEVVVTDGDLDTTTNSFAVVVGLPTISSVANQVTPQNTATAAIPFTVNDVESAPVTLTTFGTSSDQTLVPDANISVANLGGSDRSVMITPQSGQAGTAQIRLHVTDGFTTNSTTFALTVYPSLGLDFSDDFDYADGDIETVSSFVWSAHSGTNHDALVTSGMLSLNFTNTDDVHAYFNTPPYGTNSGIIAYAGFVVHFSDLPSSSGTYFAHLWPAFGFNYRARLFAQTSGAAAGDFRLGVSNGGFDVTTFPEDLILGADYNVVIGYNLGTAETKLWINPATESDLSVAAPDSANPDEMYGLAFRQAGGMGILTVDNLRVSTTFSDVLTPVTPAPIPLDHEMAGSNLVLSWANAAFSLQAAPTVSGAYTNVPGATSPYTNAITGDQMYFRLKY